MRSHAQARPARSRSALLSLYEEKVIQVSVIERVERAPRVGSVHQRDVEALRDWFCSKPFDQAFTAYYPSDVIEKYDITSPYKALRFTAGRLARAGYRGWYVVSVHDKKRDGVGSTLWHPHMMLDGRNGQMASVKRAFYPVADINCDRNGPIENLKSWGFYCAVRACERGLNSDYYLFDYMGEKKAPRGRGSRGHGGRRNPVGSAIGGTDARP